MALSYWQQRQNAWHSLGMWKHFRPDEMPHRVTKKDFEKLKAEYQERYGYYIRIPKWDEIIRLTPTSMMTLADIKAQKRQGLMNILASPAPDWARKYSSVMTWLDDIQDTTSIVYPAISMLARWFPKLFGRIIPIVGWAMLGTDLMQLLINFGRLPMTGMKGKRLLCRKIRLNPFSKQSKWDRIEKIKHFNPGFYDLLQVLQTTQMVTGVGLSLGAIMGTVQDAIFGAYRYITGERIQIVTEVPDMFEHEKMAGIGLKASAILSSTNPTFNELQHFQFYVFGAVCARLYAPWVHESGLWDAVERPAQLMIPAPTPYEQSTIDVIQEAGLNVEDGIGWPFNGKREIQISDLSMAIAGGTQDVYDRYLFRHEKDPYGYVAAACLDQVVPALIHSMDPSSTSKFEDTPRTKVAFRMVKSGLLPKGYPSEEIAEQFLGWIDDYTEIHKKTPGLIALKEKMDQLGITYRESYPTSREPEADLLWPKNLEFEDLEGEE